MKKYFILAFIIPMFLACKKKEEAPKTEEPKAEVTEEALIRQLNEDESLSRYDFTSAIVCKLTEEENGVNGFFVTAKQSARTKGEGDLNGLLYFELLPNATLSYDSVSTNFKLKFANMRAYLMNDEMEGKTHISLASDKNSLIVGQEWGPTVHKYNEKYTFSYETSLKRWALKSVSADWAGGDRAVEMKKYKIYLDNYVMSELIGQPEIFSVKYSAADLGELTKKLKAVHADSLNQFRVNPLLEVDVISIVKGITDKNAPQANDCGYLLEQMNILDQAEKILKVVVAKLPKRTVAYLNLGDVYRKQGEMMRASEAYRKYADQMIAQGKQSKIPGFVMDYIAGYEGEDVDNTPETVTTPPKASTIYGD